MIENKSCIDQRDTRCKICGWGRENIEQLMRECEGDGRSIENKR